MSDYGDVSNFEKPPLHPDETDFIINLFSDSLFAVGDDLAASLESLGDDALQDIKEIVDAAGTLENLYKIMIRTEHFKTTVIGWLADLEESLDILLDRGRVNNE
jgi:hypothetical protein